MIRALSKSHIIDRASTVDQDLRHLAVANEHGDDQSIIVR